MPVTIVYAPAHAMTSEPPGARTGIGPEPATSDPAAQSQASALAYSGALLPAFAGDLNNLTQATRYDIVLQLNNDLHHADGIQTIRYTNRAATALHEVMLRLYPNTDYLGGQMHVFDVKVDGSSVTPLAFLRPGQALTLTNSPPVTDTSVITVPLPQPLQPGDVTTLALAYTLTIQPRTSNGYLTYGWADRILALPDAYAMVPVYDADGWHVDAAPSYGDIVYAEISLYRVRITAPAELVIVATGACSRQLDSADQPVAPEKALHPRAVTDCQAGPVRDFAIQASAVFQVVSQTVSTDAGPVAVSSYYMPEYQRGGQRALEYASAALLDYSRRFGPYPYKEMKVFPSATTAGGIEYPMLAGVLDTLYGADPASLEFIVAHEVSHQWWYGMVGSDQIMEPWLDESLAQYSTSLYIEGRYGRAVADAQRNERFTQRYQQELNTGHDAPVDQPTAAFDRSMYFTIIYGKGPLFYGAVRAAVGDAQFNTWLRTFFMRYRYRIAHRDDLLNLADEMGIGLQVRMAFDQWMRRVYAH